MEPQPHASTHLTAPVACVGDNCIDDYGPPVSRRLVAGNAVNVAVGIRRAGLPVDYHGAVGDDDDGRAVVAQLAAEGIGVEHVRVLDAPTSVTHVTLTAAGDRVFAGWLDGAAELYQPGAREIAALAAAPIVHVTDLADRGAALRALVRAGARVTCDFGPEHDVAEAGGLDVAFFSVPDGAAAEEAERLAAAALAAGARTAVVMRGAQGSVGRDGDGTVRVPALPVAVVDTCGAGDSYIAAFIAARLGGGDLAACMHAATRAATATCGIVGATPSPASSDQEVI